MKTIAKNEAGRSSVQLARQVGRHEILEKLGNAMTGYAHVCGMPTLDALLVEAACEIERLYQLVGELQTQNMRLHSIIAEAVDDMGLGGRCVHSGIKGRMVQAVSPNKEVTGAAPSGKETER